MSGESGGELSSSMSAGESINDGKNVSFIINSA